MIPIQEQSELSSQFKRKQIVIWGFLFLFIAVTTGFIFYFAYRVMKDEGSRPAIEVGQSAIKTPISNQSAASSEKKHNGDHFLYGEFSPQDKKYKIFDVHYKEPVKEEIYSLLWSDPNKLPALAIHNEHIAIFPTINNAFFINRNGSLAMVDEFIPPSRYFSISPDDKKMFYFKFMSSLGNPMLILRDLEKDKDVYTWPLNSPASEICDFAGWSADGAKAYCLGKKGNAVTLKMLDTQKRSSTTITTVRDATDAEYYPEHSILLSAIKNKVFVYNQSVGEEKQIISAPENTIIKNVFLTPDGRRVLYTADNGIYSANTDGSDQKELLSGENAFLVSLSPNSRDMLFKTSDADNSRIEHYFTGDLDGKNILELFTATASAAGIQFIGWYPDENGTQ